jgi:hypothetical protein
MTDETVGLAEQLFFGIAGHLAEQTIYIGHATLEIRLGYDELRSRKESLAAARLNLVGHH